jgi:hypothetical protein
MKYRVFTGTLAAEFRQVAAWAGSFMAIQNTLDLPSNVRSVLLTLCGVILTVEHVTHSMNSAKISSEAASTTSTSPVN